MNAEERFYAELLSGNLSFVVALLGVVILYANAYLFQDYIGEVLVAYVLAQALKRGREVILHILTRLDKDGHAKEPLVDKLERMIGEFLTHLTDSNPVDTIKSYSLLLLPVLGTCLLLVRLLGCIPFIAFMVMVLVVVHLMFARLNRKFFNYRKYLTDESMASLLTMLTCLVALGSLAVFLVGGSALECVEAGRRTSAFMQDSVLSEANKNEVMRFVDQGTQQVMDRITPYLENATIALDENRLKFESEWWWPTVDRVATGLLEGTKAAAAGNDTDAEALYQVVVGSFGSVNMTEFMASVNTTAITEMLDVGSLAQKAAGAGLRIVASITSFLALLVGFLLSVLGLASFVGSLFWFLDHPRLLMNLLDDLVPVSPQTQLLITDTIQESIERVLLLPLKLASSHGIITLLTYSLLSVDFAFLATALSILLTMVPLLPPKLVCLPWTLALIVSYRTFVPILPGFDLIWVPAPLKGVLLLGLHASVMDKVDRRLFAMPRDSTGKRPQAFVTSLAFILGYQRFGAAGVLVGPGILCLGELFYALLKGLKASVMVQDVASQKVA